MTLLQGLSQDLRALVAGAAPAVAGLEHRRGQGTGFVIAPDGYLLTNAHVVGGQQEVRVRLDGGAVLTGRIIGTDAPTDLAVVRLEASGLPSLSLAARPAEVGELVVAIGNPYRFEGSVSLGVVSALDRALPSPDGRLMEGLVQTDAAVNPGNSGGPLLSPWGEVVGITTAIIPYAQGIGFAVSVRTAGWVAALLIQRGRIDRPYLGIAARSERLPPTLEGTSGQARGVRILEVQENTPAAAAKLQKNDLLLSLDDKIVESIDDLQRLMVLSSSPEVRLTVWREGALYELWTKPALPRAA
jgi:serine protease Do